ncbi:hypothetical protein [Streptomyces sp. NPDC050428]|uniref:hypothetical protein n=1 Tax=Streptomyces sp. NPDC050428 TaxID=3155757 RepID=UPI0034340D05
MNTFLGGLGTGGLALVLTVLLVLGTKQKGVEAERRLSKMQALVVGLAAGTVWTAAGQVWGMPNAFVLDALSALGVGKTNSPLGDVQMPAVAVVLAIIVYIIKLDPRTSGVTGVIMASVFASAGGGWTMVSGWVGDFFLGLAP